VAALSVYRGDTFLRRVELGQARTRIGRAPENELVLEDKDKGVSRTHAEILFERGRYVVVDLNSQNGVWMGDRRVIRDPLVADVPVTIGPYKLLLVAEDPQPTILAGGSPGGALPQPMDAPLAGPANVVRPEVQVPETQVSLPRAAPPPAAAARQTPRPRKRAIAATLAVLGVVAAVLLVAWTVRRPSPRPIDVVVAVPPAAPAGPSAEQLTQFQDHYDKAQGYFEAGDKASAMKENGDALSVLPSEPRGLQQQAAIAAMIDPSSTTSVPVGDIGATGPTGATGATASPGPAVSTLRVSSKPGETAAERANREKLARTHLEDGKKALDDRRYAAAINLFQAAIEVSGRPDFGNTKDEASNGLQAARASQGRIDAAAKRDNAQKLVEDAKALATSGDIVGAVQKLRAAITLDSQVTGAAELLTTLLEQARAQGESALTSAKNFDTFKKSDEAIKEFDKAVQLLELIPGGHKDLALARQRSAELKARR
jgi:tetratricopeptide (TPR) repeat protein